MRLITSPLIIMNVKQMARMAPYADEQKRLMKALTDSVRSGDVMQQQLAMIDHQQFQKKHKVEIWRPMVRVFPSVNINSDSL